MKIFLLCFVPLFVALDPLGIMPIFLSLTKDIARKDRQRILGQSAVTAFLISLLFLLAGRWLFNLLGISLADFQIAGGILLLIIAITDIVHPTQEQRQPVVQSIGIVPIGIPLIVGPAALTTLMMLASQYPYPFLFSALFLNLLLVMLALWFSHFVENFVGINGMKAFSKIISLFLAAIAVMFIRVGLQTILH